MPPAADLSPARQSPSGAPVVVVVDDDAAVLNSLQFALRIEGFEVRGFRSAEDLIRVGVEADAACLVVDQHLRGTTGMELIHGLRDRHPGLPAILLTSRPTAELQMQAAGRVAAIVEKPLLGNALSEAIGRALA